MVLWPEIRLIELKVKVPSESVTTSSTAGPLTNKVTLEPVSAKPLISILESLEAEGMFKNIGAGGEIISAFIFLLRFLDKKPKTPPIFGPKNSNETINTAKLINIAEVVQKSLAISCLSCIWEVVLGYELSGRRLFLVNPNITK